LILVVLLFEITLEFIVIKVTKATLFQPLGLEAPLDTY
jgi:hypothetical protein